MRRASFVLAAVFAAIAAPLSAEVLVHHCTVEAGGSLIGTVRLLDRDAGTLAVQTLLQTVLMKRVVAEIRKKEEANWPDSIAGAEAARQYLAALEAAQRRLWQERPRGTRGPNPPQRLGIEFVATPTTTWVELATFEPVGEPPQWRVESWRVLDRLALDGGYVRRNMRLILADACKLDPAAIDGLLHRPEHGQPGLTPPHRAPKRRTPVGGPDRQSGSS